MEFKDKVIIVTGAGKGIGQSIALAYARDQAIVIIAEKDQATAEQTLHKIKSQGGRAFVIVTDVSKPEEVTRLIKDTHNRFGRIDILVNNAGYYLSKSVYELEVEEWDAVIHTNLRSVFLCSREAAMVMKTHGGGAIVNIASTRALMSEPNSEAYAASKGGIVALTHALAASFAEDHIQVNAISPGWIETVDYEGLRESDHLQHFSQRVGKPEDIARACLFLTRKENNFINGTNLVIDGGMTRKMIYEP